MFIYKLPLKSWGWTQKRSFILLGKPSLYTTMNFLFYKGNISLFLKNFLFGGMLVNNADSHSPFQSYWIWIWGWEPGSCSFCTFPRCFLKFHNRFSTAGEYWQTTVYPRSHWDYWGLGLFFFPFSWVLRTRLFFFLWCKPNSPVIHDFLNPKYYCKALFFFEVCFENHFKVTVQIFTGLFNEDSKLFWLYHTCALLWASSIQFTIGHRPMGLNLINYNNRVSEHIHLCHYVINIRKWTSIIFCRGKLYEVQLEIN